MKNLNLILAAMAGMTGGAFYIPSFLTMGIGASRIIGKLHDTSWRQSKRVKSMRKRSNNKKAKRKTKIKWNNDWR